MEIRRGDLYNAKHRETSRMMCLQGRCIPWRSPKWYSPQLACQEFHKGANSGSTWGWLLLEGGKKPEMIFGVGQLPAAWHIPFFDQLPQYEYVTLAETFFPIKATYPHYNPSIFSSLGCIWASRPFTFYFQNKKQPILNLPLLLHETRLGSWPHMLLYLI